MERWSIAVVGAGAAGLMAAWAAARRRKDQGKAPGVVLLEGNPRPGKKLLATGNGRCNLTNLNAGPSHYHGDVSLAAPLLDHLTPGELLKVLEGMGPALPGRQRGPGLSPQPAGRGGYCKPCAPAARSWV